MKVEFHPAAEVELAAAVEVGEARAPGLGAELLHEVRRGAALVTRSSHRGVGYLIQNSAHFAPFGKRAAVYVLSIWCLATVVGVAHFAMTIFAHG
jgi:hypothetical protein